MKDKGIDKGLVQEFETSNKRIKGHHYGFRKMFWEYLNKLGVHFTDPCCPEASTTAAPDFATDPLIFPVTQDNIVAGTGGAISVANYLTTINTDAGGDAFTLADGTITGQVKKILLVVDGGGDATITPANFGASTTITMGDAGDYVVLVWDGTDWITVENSGSALA